MMIDEQCINCRNFSNRPNHKGYGFCSVMNDVVAEERDDALYCNHYEYEVK